MKNPKIDIVIQDNIHCGDEELIIWRACMEGVENVDSVGVVRIDHKTMRGFEERGGRMKSRTDCECLEEEDVLLGRQGG
jgi:hypothetical protein